MKKEIAELWCKALRSEAFKQGKEGLYRDGAYCVMGVLCALAMEEGICDFEEKHSFGFFDGRPEAAPTSVKEWSGLSSGSGYVTGMFLTLQGLNDYSNWDFTELAQLIEDRYAEL